MNAKALLFFLMTSSDTQTIDGRDGFVTLVSVSLDAYLQADTLENKTVTIPRWLNRAATAKGLNFSSVLREALIRRL